MCSVSCFYVGADLTCYLNPMHKHILHFFQDIVLIFATHQVWLQAVVWYITYFLQYFFFLLYTTLISFIYFSNIIIHGTSWLIIEY
jgi:hypothetical protein